MGEAQPGGRCVGQKRVTEAESVTGWKDRAEQTAHPSQEMSSRSCLILWTLTGMPLQLRPLKEDVWPCPYLWG